MNCLAVGEAYDAQPMTQTAALEQAAVPLPDPRRESSRQLLRQLLVLALPVLAEHSLHIGVGITDTYLANHLVASDGLAGAALDAVRSANAASGAAVGSITYITWFIGLLVTSVGTGSTAIIARATGARHRRLANKVTGQSISAALVLGCVFAAIVYFFSPQIARLADLKPEASAYFQSYLRILVFGLPAATVMFTANSCLRGAGDTVTPAVAMIVVDVVNVLLSFSLTYGLWGMPNLGFDGIAIGTTCAYLAGGVMQFIVLLSGRGKLRLFLHRLKPDWTMLRRILRIGLPSGAEGMLQWAANFGVLAAVNNMSDAAAAAHSTAIKVESLSYMSGFAFGIATAAMVGQSLGMKSARRAWRVAYLGYAVGGLVMTILGIAFVAFSHFWANLFLDDPAVAAMTARSLFITGFIQCGFAAMIIFGSALKGAGDTLAVMLISLSSVIFVRFVGVMIVARYLGLGLAAVWMVLAGELFLRGILIFIRFQTGRWVSTRV